MKALSLIASVLIAATSFAVGQAQPSPAPRLMTPGEILRVANVGDAQISPNGQWVVYTVSKAAGDDTISNLWLAEVGADWSAISNRALSTTSQNARLPALPYVNAMPSPLLDGNWNASNPRWSPDSSKIAFLSDHNAQRGLWVVNLENREPRFITGVQSTNFFITYAGESLAWGSGFKTNRLHLCN